jgi:hypothetical protein
LGYMGWIRRNLLRLMCWRTQSCDKVNINWYAHRSATIVQSEQVIICFHFVGIKEYSDWPTIPQLYVEKEFIGGCDILMSMHQNGELSKLLEEKGVLMSSETRPVNNVNKWPRVIVIFRILASFYRIYSLIGSIWCVSRTRRVGRTETYLGSLQSASSKQRKEFHLPPFSWSNKHFLWRMQCFLASHESYDDLFKSQACTWAQRRIICPIFLVSPFCSVNHPTVDPSILTGKPLSWLCRIDSLASWPGK